MKLIFMNHFGTQVLILIPLPSLWRLQIFFRNLHVSWVPFFLSHMLICSGESHRLHILKTVAQNFYVGRLQSRFILEVNLRDWRAKCFQLEARKHTRSWSGQNFRRTSKKIIHRGLFWEKCITLKEILFQ